MLRYPDVAYALVAELAMTRPMEVPGACHPARREASGRVFRRAKAA